MDFTLWIWPGYEDAQEAEIIRGKLKDCGLEWDEKVEENFSCPVTLDTIFGELTAESIEMLKEFSYSDSGELLFNGKTVKEYDSDPVVLDEEAILDAEIEEANMPDDK